MNPEPTAEQPLARRSSVFRNWLSLTGLVVVVGSLFSFLLLLLLDALAHFANPYIGILTYLVAPAFLMIGLVLALWAPSCATVRSSKPPARCPRSESI